MTDFYVNCPVCSGSRAALLTGCYYPRVSMTPVLFPGSKTGLHPNEITIAEVLKPLGYATACIGKWHQGHLPQFLPVRQGFDYYFGHPLQQRHDDRPGHGALRRLVLREGMTPQRIRSERGIHFPLPATTCSMRAWLTMISDTLSAAWTTPELCKSSTDGSASEEACAAYLQRVRWPEGFRCPRVRREGCLCHDPRSTEVSEVSPADVANCGNHLSGYAKAIAHVVPSDLVCHESEVRREVRWACSGSWDWAATKQLGLGSISCAVRWCGPGRDRLQGCVEVDETYLGGTEEGRSRAEKRENKAIVAVAAEEDGRGIGRLRLRRIADASADSLHPFVRTKRHAWGDRSHGRVARPTTASRRKGYTHEVTVLSQHDEPAHQLMPRVHRVASLLKRWLLGTHQGAVSGKHLD